MMTYIFMLATKVVANFVTERMSVTSCITNLKNKKKVSNVGDLNRENIKH